MRLLILLSGISLFADDQIFGSILLGFNSQPPGEYKLYSIQLNPSPISSDSSSFVGDCSIYKISKNEFILSRVEKFEICEQVKLSESILIYEFESILNNQREIVFDGKIFSLAGKLIESGIVEIYILDSGQVVQSVEIELGDGKLSQVSILRFNNKFKLIYTLINRKSVGYFSSVNVSVMFPVLSAKLP